MSKVRIAVDQICTLPFGVKKSNTFRDDLVGSLADWCFRGAIVLQEEFGRMFYLTYGFKGATIKDVTADHLRVGGATFANETAIEPRPPAGREHDEIKLMFWLCITPATWAKLNHPMDSEEPLSLAVVSIAAHEAMQANWGRLTVPSLRRTLAHELYHFLQTRATPPDKRADDIKHYRRPNRALSGSERDKSYAAYYRQPTEVGAYAAQVAEQLRHLGVTPDDLRVPGALERHLRAAEPDLMRFYLQQGGEAKKRFLKQVYQHLSR
jgi:hypothetical protein